jgi:hypothetical protein
MTLLRSVLFRVLNIQLSPKPHPSGPHAAVLYCSFASLPAATSGTCKRTSTRAARPRLPLRPAPLPLSLPAPSKIKREGDALSRMAAHSLSLFLPVVTRSLVPLAFRHLLLPHRLRLRLASAVTPSRARPLGLGARPPRHHAAPLGYGGAYMHMFST